MEKRGTRLAGIQDEERQELRKRQTALTPAPVKDLGGAAHLLRNLQRTAGNAAVNQLLRQYAAQRALQRCGAHGHGGEELDVQRSLVQRAALLVQRDDQDDEEDQTASSGSTTATDDQSSASGDSSASSSDNQVTSSSDSGQSDSSGESADASSSQTGTDQSQSSSDDQSQSSGDGQSQDTGTGQELVVQEDFQPAPGQGLPDEDTRVAQVGPQDGGQQDDQAVAAPRVRFTDLGRTGTARYGDRLTAGSEGFPQAFTNGGRTGTVVWAGGGGAGAHGNESAGSVQAQTAPAYVASGAAPFTAWVQSGTGTLDVTRSWVGINAGDQGNGHFVTAAAAARINQHETLHVASTRGIYGANIDPLLTRVGAATQAAASAPGAPSAATQADAINNLKAVIKWPQSVTAFQNADIAANAPMNTVDTNDLASGTYPVDAGPGTVGGTAFQHRVRTPSEPNPT